MCNEEIIYKFKEANGIKVAIHTFAHWKQLGFKVRKGEHASYRIPIYKMCSKKDKVDGKETVSKFFVPKESCFFSELQVEKIEEKK